MTAKICMAVGCTRPLVYKKLGLCQTHYQQQRRKQEKNANDEVIHVIPPEIIEQMQHARTTEDWQKLGAALTPTMAAIMSGTLNATAAQVSLIKDIMNRAYGKPVATQAEKKVSTGIVLLPTLSTEVSTLICPKCAFNALELLQDDATKQLAVRILQELLEKLISDNKPTTAMES